MVNSSSIGHKLENLPLWLLFGLMIISMAYITVNPLGIKIPTSLMTITAYNAVNSLEAGDIVLIDLAYGPGTVALHQPGYQVLFRHMMSKQVKMVVHSHGAASPLMYIEAMKKINTQGNGYEYGRDWVYLGYVAGTETAAAATLANIFDVFTVDYFDTPLAQLPLMDELKGVETYTKLSMVFELSNSVDNTDGWVRQAGVRYNIPFVIQPISKDVPNFIPFYPLNIRAIISGGSGAAEYEVISGFPGDAVALSDITTMGGLVVLAFVIMGNIGFLLKRGERR